VLNSKYFIPLKYMEERSHLEELDADGSIILPWVFKKFDGGGINWIDLTQDRDRWRDLLNAVLKLRVAQNSENFLTSWVTIGFSRRTLLFGDGHGDIFVVMGLAKIQKFLTQYFEHRKRYGDDKEMCLSFRLMAVCVTNKSREIVTWNWHKQVKN